MGWGGFLRGGTVGGAISRKQRACLNGIDMVGGRYTDVGHDGHVYERDHGVSLGNDAGQTDSQRKTRT